MLYLIRQFCRADSASAHLQSIILFPSGRGMVSLKVKIMGIPVHHRRSYFYFDIWSRIEVYHHFQHVMRERCSNSQKLFAVLNLLLYYYMVC